MGLRSGANRAFWLAGLFIAFWSCKAIAISGNDQVSLAGTGQFEQLVTALEQQAASEPMKVADWHALCYSYFRIKRYDKIFSCLHKNAGFGLDF